ncbi:MAG: Kelch repeat-containing protein [Planctomycetota bacterium]
MKAAASLTLTGALMLAWAHAGELKLSHAANGGRGPLRGLPSAPGAHLARVKALGANSWLDLGSPAPDPKWGKARGRSWSPKMVPVPDLRGAFVAGQGVHGFVKPDGHYQDDLFFYDINAHRWVCVYPGADVKNISLKVNGEGFEVDKDGQPIPVAWCGHMYQDITYNPDEKKLMFMDNGDPYWKKPLARRLKWLEGKKLAHRSTPWYWNTVTGKFERRVCSEHPPRHGYGKVLIYVGGGRSFYWRGMPWKSVWFHDHRTSKWTEVKPAGDFPPWGAYVNACYDAKRRRIYLGGRGGKGVKPEDNLYVYDIAAKTWANPKPKGARLAFFANNAACMYFDSASDVVTVFARSSRKYGEDLGVHVYDPAANEWREPLPMPPAVKQRTVRRAWSGFYDAELNAHFLHAAGDSRDNGTMLVYRYRPAPGRKR